MKKIVANRVRVSWLFVIIFLVTKELKWIVIILKLKKERKEENWGGFLGGAGPRKVVGKLMEQ